MRSSAASRPAVANLTPAHHAHFWRGLDAGSLMEIFWKIAMFGPWYFKTLPVVPPLHLQEAALKTQRVSTPDTKRTLSRRRTCRPHIYCGVLRKD